MLFVISALAEIFILSMFFLMTQFFITKNSTFEYIWKIEKVEIAVNSVLNKQKMTSQSFPRISRFNICVFCSCFL